MKYQKTGIVILLTLLIGQVSAKEMHAIDEFGLHTWKFEQKNLIMTVSQRKPSQTESFFIARNLPSALSEQIAQSCTLQLTVENTKKSGASSIDIDLRNWIINTNQQSKQSQRIKTKQEWLTDWEEKLSAAQIAAFQWATFPTEQNFYANDMNMGMITINQPQGTIFDLTMMWKVNNQDFRHTIQPKI